MYSLFLDTTNLAFCYLAIYCDKKLCFQQTIAVNKNITDIIVPLINSLLVQQGLTYCDIKRIYLNIGPGSFTGLKVNVVIAKAWKLVYPQTKIFVASSLLLQTNEKKCLSVIDAKSNLFFAAVIKQHQYLVQPCLLSKHELSEMKQKYSSWPCLINQQETIGTNFLFHYDYFQEINQLQDLIPLYLKPPV